MSQNQFFEGPEKKLEMIFEKGGLLQKPREYWDQIVDLAEAKILSELKSKDVQAYLLSESSLFVWDNRLIMITCGTTKLIKASEKLSHDFQEGVVSVFYERKNEYQPELQKSSALQDIDSLNRLYKGEAFRFGRQDDHHLYLFNKLIEQSDVPLDKEIKTVELLMYGLRGEFKDLFTPKPDCQKSVLEKFSQIFEGFQLDPYFFEPYGFSLNGLKGDQYITIHVTPQGDENYFSFEMDQYKNETDDKILKDIIELCSPSSFDLISFSKESLEIDLGLHTYKEKQKQSQKLQTDYEVCYAHYYDYENLNSRPVRLLGDEE